MPRNPAKRRCVFPDCRAWARRGGSLCASHGRARALRQAGELVLPLFEAVAEAEPPAAPAGASARRAWLAGPPTDRPPYDPATLHDDLALIDEELRRLFEARAQFLAWVEQARQEDRGAQVTPSSFLRAWNDSSARVIQLLRARRELTGAARPEDSLFNAVYDALEAMLPQEAVPQEAVPQVYNETAEDEGIARSAGGATP